MLSNPVISPDILRELASFITIPTGQLPPHLQSVLGFPMQIDSSSPTSAGGSQVQQGTTSGGDITKGTFSSATPLSSLANSMSASSFTSTTKAPKDNPDDSDDADNSNDNHVLAHAIAKLRSKKDKHFSGDFLRRHLVTHPSVICLGA